VGFAGITDQSAAAELRKRFISLTEFERGIIRERVDAGLPRARANGKLGRCRIDPAVEARVLELKAGGNGILEVARQRVQSSSEAIERVAQTTGFRDPERMRRAFIRAFGQPPQSLRQAARVG
jgi:hypothetical protein